ncbi:MAG: cobyrinic acid a,c-diamide synthase [Methylophaga sp.]|nr:MAG: cobyrinic acid a,c-diamide synthase [Methylophaga sp.]
MSRVIAIMNQKGGVGKTTTTINLGHALALAGKKVTLLDMDPQGQTATGYGVAATLPGLDEVLLDDVHLDELTISVKDNLTVVPAGKRLADFEHMTTGGSERAYVLQKAIAVSSLSEQDFVLIDCPPSSGLLGMNAMFAAAEVLIPISGDYLSLHGLSRMIQILKRAESLTGQTIKLWLVSTRMQLRRRLTQEVRNKILKYFPGRVLNTVIRENVSLAESPSFGQTIFDYKNTSAGAEDYSALAQDLLKGRTS